MKIYKKNHHSLFVKPFGIRDKLYLALTVFIYFDLAAPDDPLTEQELWKTIPDQLRPQPLLDAGMPKPRGEVLITGSCFAPRGQTRPAGQVSWRVGELSKRLTVFGNRYWLTKDRVIPAMTDLESFSEMPIIYGNAFGGKDFALNPLGKGIDEIARPGGQTIIPLPNIETSHHPVAHPNDRPEPAGFGPIDMMWPQRMKKNGTYDDKWLRENWPWFPDDMDYEFFNCAPEDQFIAGFFTGKESIDIRGMHPDLPVISSHLPPLRIRCFVTKCGDLKKKEAEDIFQEVTTRIDTLWLFPSILRGVVMYRGTTEVHDEEYEDVVRIFIATEPLKESPLPLEHYLEEQKKAMDTKVAIDMAPLQEAAKKIGKMIKRVKKIPKDIDHSIKMATGRAPVMPRTPAETAAVGQQVIRGNLALIDQLEAQSRNLHGKLGLSGGDNPAMFVTMRDALQTASAAIGSGLTSIDAAQAKALTDAAAHLKEIAEKVKKNVPSDIFAKAGFDPEALLDRKKKVNPWHDRGFPLVVEWRRNLESDQDTRDALHALGIEDGTIKRAWLGTNPAAKKDAQVRWGLKPAPDDPQDFVPEDDLALPAGLILPRFHEATLNRILILPGAWQQDGSMTGAELVDGSDETPLLLIAEDGAPVVACADELQALLMEQEIGDACSVICLTGPDEKPSPEGETLIKGAEAFLVVMPGGAAAGNKDWDAWRKAYPDCRPYALPKGANLFAATKLGVDIRDWIMEALPEAFQKRHKIAPTLPAPGKYPTEEDLIVPIPALDVKALVEKSSQEIRGFVDGKTSAMVAKHEQMEAELMDRAAEAVKKAGLNPEEVLKKPPAPKPVPITEAADSMLAKLDQTVAALKKGGGFSPEMEGKFNDMAARIQKLSREGQARLDAGLAKITAAREMAVAAAVKVKAREMPLGAKEVFAKYGMDTDRMVPRTREDVIAMHGRGESLSFARLAGVDLSGLDLGGIDLREAQCQKTNFSGTCLDGADLTQVMAVEADFTGASLARAKLDKIMLIKAKLGKADLRAAEMNQATIKDADLAGADLSGSTLFMVTIIGTSLAKARMNGVRADLSVFSDGDASDGEFKEIRLERCLIRRLTLDRADFSQAVLPATTFMEVKGEDVCFAGADMHKSRLLNNSCLPRADLRQVTFTQGSLRDTDLTGAMFAGSCLEGALIEKCNLTRADLYGVHAQMCRFAKSNLEGADMRYINLHCGSLRKSRLVNADLRGANLYAVDFYKTIFGKTQIEDANIKKSLIFKHTEELHIEKGIR